jgi:hypothetical protein
MGGVMHQLQPGIIPELIARFGNGWQCAAINKELPPILRSVVVRGNIGGYGPVYEDLREADPIQEIKVIQKLRSSQAHCVRAHHGRLALIIRSLFEETQDELIKTVKKIVFDVDDGKAILPSDHPVFIELAKLSKGACAQRLACLCLAFDAASSFQSPSTSS